VNQQIENINFYYEVYGEGAPILFFNSFGSDLSLLRSSFEPIFHKDSGPWKRIYVDHPGVGNTKVEGKISTKEILGSMKQLTDRLVGEEEFLLVGASFGGYISRFLLNEFNDQVKGLFLLYPLIKENPEDADIEHEVRSKQNTVYIADEKKVMHIQSAVTNSMKKTDFQLLESLMKEAQELEREETLQTSYYNKPVCILTGRQDETVGYKDAFHLIDYFPKATYCVLDNAGHQLQLEQNQLFTIFVKDWLSRVSSSV
jgi:pimeloyl-ACP methyl ester carboxylesterase